MSCVKPNVSDIFLKLTKTKVWWPKLWPFCYESHSNQVFTMAFLPKSLKANFSDKDTFRICLKCWDMWQSASVWWRGSGNIDVCSVKYIANVTLTDVLNCLLVRRTMWRKKTTYGDSMNCFSDWTLQFHCWVSLWFSLLLHFRSSPLMLFTMCQGQHVGGSISENCHYHHQLQRRPVRVIQEVSASVCVCEMPLWVCLFYWCICVSVCGLCAAAGA